MKITIPLGDLNDKAIEEGVVALSTQISTLLQSRFNGEVLEEEILRQHQVKDDDSGVALKCLQRQIRVRLGAAAGANIDLVYNWRYPSLLEVRISPRTWIEDKLAAAAPVIAGVAGLIVAICITSPGRRASKIIGIVSALLIWLALFLLNWTVGKVLSPKSAELLRSIEEIAQQAFAHDSVTRCT